MARPKGAKNKSTTAIFDLMKICEERGFSPFESMIEIAQTAESEDTRLAALKEVCQYILPKKKAVEVSLDPALADKATQIKNMTREEQIVLLKEQLKRLEGNVG